MEEFYVRSKFSNWVHDWNDTVINVIFILSHTVYALFSIIFEIHALQLVNKNKKKLLNFLTNCTCN